jgi:hypothetical protein
MAMTISRAPRRAEAALRSNVRDVRTRLSWLVLAACLAISARAHAGRSFYGWLYDTDVMPERGAELQTWVLERDDFGSNNEHETGMWFGALVGITDQLELALPVEFDWTDADMQAPDFTLRRYGVELRYRLVPPDGKDTSAAPAAAAGDFGLAPPPPPRHHALVPLIRVAAKRDVVDRGATIIEADLVTTYQAGRVHADLDLGAVATIEPSTEAGGSHFQARPGLGISIRTTGELRFGAELYGELDVDDSNVRWLALGPNMAWTHGRFWLSAAYGIGITGITAAPRMMWGVAF